MPKTVNVGYTDTAISGVTSLTFPRGLLNYKVDYRVKSDTSNELILTNLTSPVDRPERIRISYQEISNIYSGTDIDASVYSPSKRGTSILVQLTEILSVTDSTVPAFRVDLPLSIHLVLKVPANENLTSDIVLASLGRLISGLFETGSTANTRMNSLLRGSLSPSDL